MGKKHFCTCKDLKCKLHPTNHDLGCDPCIKKNLKCGEIPSCFFRAIHDNLDGQDEFSYKAFSNFFLKHTKNN